MTVDQAIYILRNTAWLGSNKDREQMEEAVEMAVEALNKAHELPSAQPDIARDIATILENEQDMRVILQNAQPTQSGAVQCVESVGDCISRQAAIDIVQGYAEQHQGYIGMPNDSEVYAYARGLLLSIDRNIKALTSAQPKQQWIPCSERLPEEDADVLIAYRHKDGEGDTSHVYIDITSYGDMYFGGNRVHDFFGKKIKHWRQPFAYFTSNYEVIAWMPLPEPYRGGEEE